MESGCQADCFETKCFEVLLIVDREMVEEIPRMAMAKAVES